MIPKVRKLILALLKKRREEAKSWEAAHKGLMASYNRLYDDFMREKQRAGDLERRLERLADAHVASGPPHGDVCCSWRVSKTALKYARDREVIWEEVFRKLRTELFRWQEGKS